MAGAFEVEVYRWPEQGDNRCGEAFLSVLKEGHAGDQVPTCVQAHLRRTPILGSKPFAAPKGGLLVLDSHKMRLSFRSLKTGSSKGMPDLS